MKDKSEVKAGDTIVHQGKVKIVVEDLTINVPTTENRVQLWWAKEHPYMWSYYQEPKEAMELAVRDEKLGRMASKLLGVTEDLQQARENFTDICCKFTKKEHELLDANSKIAKLEELVKLQDEYVEFITNNLGVVSTGKDEEIRLRAKITQLKAEL